MPDLNDIIYIEISTPGLPGTGVTSTDWNALKAQADAATAKLANFASTDLVDTQLPPRSDGFVMQWSSALSKWISAAVSATVAYVKQNNSVIVPNADRLNYINGIQVVQDPGTASQANISPIYGSSANTVASGDHSHSGTLFAPADIAATGVLSSGSRTLATMNLGPLAVGTVYDIEATFRVHARNNVNSGNFALRLQIQGGSLKSVTRPTVGGVPIEYTLSWYYQAMTGAGTNVTVTASVAYVDGDPTDFRDGQLFAVAHPRR